MTGKKWALAVFLAIVFGVAALWALALSSHPYASASTPRKNSHYDEAFLSRPISASPSNFLARTILKTNGNKISVTMPAVPRGEQQIDFEMIRAGNDQRVKLGPGELTLQWVATGYTNMVTPGNFSAPVHPTFYSPKLERVGTNNLKGELPQQLHFRGKYPEAVFYFAATNLPPFKMVSFKVFDARTHWLINQGYNSHVQHGGVQVGTTMQIWHQAPFQIALTLAVGEPQIRLLDIDDTTAIKYKHGLVRLLAGFPKPAENFSSNSGNGTNVVSFNIADSSDSKISSFAFLFWPSVASVPVDIHFTRENGSPLRSGGSSSMDNVHLVTVKEEITPGSKIQLTYYPRIYQLVFNLPELPGLPEENLNIENLFDVQIPSLQIRHEYEFMSTLGHLVAGTPHMFNLNYPEGYFPRYYTNITPADLLAEITSLTPPADGPIVFNPETCTIEHRSNLFTRIRRKISQWFH